MEYRQTIFSFAKKERNFHELENGNCFKENSKKFKKEADQ